MMKQKKQVKWDVGGCLAIAALMAFLFVALVGAFQWSWNAFMASVVGLPAIDYVQAFAGILFLIVSGTALGLWKGN